MKDERKLILYSGRTLISLRKSELQFAGVDSEKKYRYNISIPVSNGGQMVITFRKVK